MANLIPAENSLTSSEQADLSDSDLPAIFLSSSPEETFSLGRKAARFLGKGSVVALKGELGSGKTCLAKGIAKGLGIEEELTSPTYTIISEYELISGSGETVPVYHIDAYRLGGNEDFSYMGGEEIVFGNGISLIEWSERIFSFIPPEALKIDIEIVNDDKRLIRIYKSEIPAPLENKR